MHRLNLKSLTSMIEDQNSRHAKEYSENEFESLSMTVGESARELVARAKGPARAVEYYGIGVTEEKLCRRIFNGIPPVMHFVREVLEPSESFPSLTWRRFTNGHALAAGFR